MSNVLIIDHPWDKSWINLYAEAFESCGCSVEVSDGKSMSDKFNPDIVFCTWADRDFTKEFPGAQHIMMMRRFEFFHSPWKTYDWDKISLLVCCNPWIAGMVAEEIKNDSTTVLCVRNSIDPTLWSFKERRPGKKIGMVCRVHPVKNLSLAVQILLMLKDYELHIAGPIQDPNIATYLSFILGQRVKFYGNIDRKHLDEWWEDKNYCLSTSISEGDPMSLLEAMAKGIKPIVHNWPGANELYETFSTVDEAITQIKTGYDSSKYRQMVLDNNAIGNINFLVQLVLKGANHGKHERRID